MFFKCLFLLIFPQKNIIQKNARVDRFLEFSTFWQKENTMFGGFFLLGEFLLCCRLLQGAVQRVQNHWVWEWQRWTVGRETWDLDLSGRLSSFNLLVVSVFVVILGTLIFHIWNINLAFYVEMGFALPLCHIFNIEPNK